ncbi:serine hydrolase domain-containing protein [Actinosynnema sp. NPDC023587]|uniref:serine hydrolase domain-containing protein n=1 Tax=Actinosynnema sp. NPDC023587 TaxID=3154695 RepID=UPI0033FE52D8
MKRTSVLVAALCVALGASVGMAGAVPEASSALSRQLQRDADVVVRYGAPGVLVEADTGRGEVKVRSGYGDKRARTPVPWDAKFRIGSTTKMYVATAVLKLVGEGRLSLEDTVERWLPGVVSGNGNDGRKITVRQLLQHTSGLYDYTRDLPQSLEGFLRTRFDTVTDTEATRMALSHAPDFAPGTAWSYSNTGYLLVGMIIEEVAGRSWRDEVTARIIRPLGLHDTSAPHTSPFIPRPHAVGYQRFPVPGGPGPSPEVDATWMNPSPAGAAGAMIGTTGDGTRFLKALFGGEVLRPAELAEMKKTVPAPSFESVWPGARYGLGLIWRPNPCGGVWSHGGDISGFMTRNGVSEDGERGVVVSINTDSPVPADGTPAPAHDLATDLVDHALCGVE